MYGRYATGAILAVVLSLLVARVDAQETTGPVDPRLTPQWTRVAGVTEVEYAPNLQTDVFRYQGSYYCWHDGRWHRTSTWGGAWAVIPQPPPVLSRIEPAYFKNVPPGWSRGRKTGWRGGAMPPGQAKKAGRAIVVEPTVPVAPAPAMEGIPPGQGKGKGKGLPPGQRKKWQ